MTALAMDVRELSFDEIDNVSGGPIPLIAWGIGIAIGAGVAYVGANFAAGAIDGARGNASQVG